MATSQRDKFVEEIKKYEDIITHTNSKYLKRDYQKKLVQMKLDLMEYDRYHKASA